MSDLPKFVHDTYRIIDVNDAGCLLFRCDRVALIDLDMLELIVREDYRGLAQLRLREMREKNDIGPFLYKFRRCDETQFWAATVTERLETGCFETTLVYAREVRQ